MTPEETKAATETRSYIQLQQRLVIDGDDQPRYEFRFSDRPDEVFESPEELHRSRGLPYEKYGCYKDTPTLDVKEVLP